MLRFNKKNIFKSYTLFEPNHIGKIIIPRWYYKIEAGDYTYINDEIDIKGYRSPQTIKIGKYCSIGRCFFKIDGDHNVNYASTFPFKEFNYSKDALENKNIKKSPIIGNDVWISDDTTIYGGLIIGDGSIIAGNAVVTKDVEPYSIVGGNPARVLKYRFSKEIIEELLELKWWNLNNDFICKELAINLDDINAFINKIKKYKLNNIVE